MKGLNDRESEVKLDDLYQEVILDHNKRPRHFIKLEHPSTAAHGHNPLCGDDFILELQIEEGRIRAIGFQGQGCAISKASASMMAAFLNDKTVEEALSAKRFFIELLTAGDLSVEEKKKLGHLKIFEGVKKFPIRVKCATLIWRTLEEALRDPQERVGAVSTEA